MTFVRSIFRHPITQVHCKNVGCSVFNDIRFLCSKNDRPPFDKYKIFKDEDSDIIFDVQEERNKQRQDRKIVPDVTATLKRPIGDLPLKRSTDKVFAIEEIVELVQSNKGKDICVLKIPPDFQYVDFMVITSGISRRHIQGLAELIRKEYKTRVDLKVVSPPRIEGEDSNWVALDLGNIVLHIMMNSVRVLYDLESLWAIGPKYDLKSNATEDDTLNLLRQHSINLRDLQPAIDNVELTEKIT